MQNPPNPLDNIDDDIERKNQITSLIVIVCVLICVIAGTVYQSFHREEIRTSPQEKMCGIVVDDFTKQIYAGTSRSPDSGRFRHITLRNDAQEEKTFLVKLDEGKWQLNQHWKEPRHALALNSSICIIYSTKFRASEHEGHYAYRFPAVINIIYFNQSIP